jgi:hypothetical protein
MVMPFFNGRFIDSEDLLQEVDRDPCYGPLSRMFLVSISLIQKKEW